MINRLIQSNQEKLRLAIIIKPGQIYINQLIIYKESQQLLKKLKMQNPQIQSLIKSRRQLQQKFSSLKELQQKLKEMDKKTTHKGYVSLLIKLKQKVNSVMMRNVQVKHTSELMIRLNNQYFAQVKTHSALEYLSRKSKIYEQNLMKVNLRIEVMEENRKGMANQQKQSINKNYNKSTVQSIGKNEQGEQIFNIMQVQEDQQQQQQTGTPQAIQTHKNHEDTTVNSIKTEQTKVKQQKQLQRQITQKTNSNKVIQGKSSSGQQQSQEGGDLLADRGQYSSGQSSLDQIDEEQNDDEFKKSINKLTSKEEKVNKLQPSQVAAQAVESQKSTSHKEPITKQSQINPQQSRTKPTNQTQSKSTKTQKKPIQPIRQQPPQQQKPISRFKLQRMKQKLQASIQ